VISVCAPYWNRQDALDGMVSMYQDLYPDLGVELSICDDGSPVPARAPHGVTLTRLPTKDHPLNPCAPMNRAVEASSGDIIVLTNPEVRHEGPVLREVLDLLDERTYVAARCRGIGYRIAGVWLAGPDADYSLYGRLPVPPGAHFHFLAAMHRSLWERVGGMDEDYRHVQGCDDNDLLWRLHRAGARFRCAEGVVTQPRSDTHWGLPHGRDLFFSKWPEAGT
jgi:hypothetical protein